MTDDRDPLIADALRRLASAAPQPRADRLQAVVEGVHRRRQLRMTTSALTAAAFVVAAAVGVHIWTTPASDTTTGPGPTLPPISASPDPAVSSAPASLSPIASASARGTGDRCDADIQARRRREGPGRDGHHPGVRH